MNNPLVTKSIKTANGKESSSTGIILRRATDMSSRGSVAKNGHFGTDQYRTVEVLPSGARVLEGNGNYHSLPDYSHSPNSVYVRYNANKTSR